MAILILAGPLAAQEKLPPIKTVTIGEHGGFIVNGKPFIPLMAWLQQEKDFPLLRELGFNTMSGYWWNRETTPVDEAAAGILAYAEAVHKAGMYYELPYEHELLNSIKTVAGKDYVLLWCHNDEPDMPRKVDPEKYPEDKGLPPGIKFVPRETPEQCMEKYRRIRRIDPKRPVSIGMTAHFMSDVSKFTAEQRKTFYPEFVKASECVGFDTYPIFGSAWPGHLCRVADGTRELRALAGPKRAVLCAIETNKGSRWVTPAKQLDVFPEHMRAEVWMAMIQGATGIAYFTHSWVGPDGSASYTTFAPTPEMQKELKRLNAQLARLAPAILAAPARARIAMTLVSPEGSQLRCHFKATQPDGTVYVFAQNLDLGPNAEKLRQFEPISPRNGKATITVAGLKAGTKIEVVDEDRSITAGNGQFTDEFGHLAEHIYRIPMN